jgi:opacity protein-like surface antigen
MRVLAAAALLALAAPASAADGPQAERGPIFSLRAGYGVPAGDVVRGGPAVSEVAERKFPLGFELGYRLTRRFWAQLDFELAPATPAKALCAGGTSCSASDVRVGAEVVVRLLPGAAVDPWIAAGAGVEVLNAEGRGGPAGAPVRTKWSWAGPELPYLEAGADFAVSSWIGVGPWASISFARFTSDSVKLEGADEVSGATRGRTVHRWVSAGLQATLRL